MQRREPATRASETTMERRSYCKCQKCFTNFAQQLNFGVKFWCANLLWQMNVKLLGSCLQDGWQLCLFLWRHIRFFYGRVWPRDGTQGTSYQHFWFAISICWSRHSVTKITHTSSWFVWWLNKKNICPPHCVSENDQVCFVVSEE